MQVRESFVGRHAELDELRAAVDASVEGRGALLLLSGEPGIGKTTLADAAAAHAVDAGVDVRRASCWEGPAPAFWPWVQLVRAHIEAGYDPPLEVQRLVGDATSDSSDVREGDAETVRFTLFDAVATFFRTESRRVPLMLVIDDLHWADVPSLRLLEFFAGDLRGSSLVVVGTFRDVEVDRATDTGRALDRVCEGARLFRLEGLEPTEVAELLQANTGSLASTEFARAVHRRTGGNPLFVRELARLLVASGRAETARVPDGVTAVIQRRLARLSQACHHLLVVAAVVGNDFRVDLAASAAGIDVRRALELLEEAITARLIAPVIAPGASAVGGYAFSHALVRDTLTGAIPLSRGSEIHLAVARAIEALGAPDAYLPALAHHYLETLPSGDTARAIDYCERAGRQALERLAYEDAVAHFRRGVAVLDVAPDDDRRAALLLELGDAQLRSGDMPGARETFDAVANLARRRGRPDELARAALGFGAGLAGFEIRMIDQQQIELLEEAGAALGGRDSSLLAHVLARLSVAVAFQKSMDERRDLAEKAVEMARRVGDTRALAYALGAHCDAIAGPEFCEARIAEATEMVALSRAHSDRAMELLGRRLLVLAHLEVGDLSAAFGEMDAFERTAELIRQPLYSWYPALWKGMRAALEGRTEDALAAANDAEAIGARAHSDNAPMLAKVLRMVVAYYLEDYDGLKEVGEELMTVTVYAPAYMDFYMSVIYSLRGGLDIARPYVERFATGAMSTFPHDAEWLPGMCTFAEALWIVGNIEGAAMLYDLMLPHRKRFAVEGIAAGTYGSIEHYLGLLACACGKIADAESHFDAAIAANAPLGGPLIIARTQRELARLLAERSAPGDAQRAADLEARSRATRSTFGVRETGSETVVTSRPTFRQDGEFWTLDFDGRVANMKDAKGLRDLAQLLARPGREIAALDLAADRGATARPTGEDLHAEGHAGELLDEKARAAYKARLGDLEDEIADADELGDSARAERAKTERDTLAHELASAYGLGGRARRAGDPAERARTTVTRRIRDAMSRIEDVHPTLGRHLRKSVRTGTFCVYDPEDPTAWAT